jgi:hypothetical protein
VVIIYILAGTNRLVNAANIARNIARTFSILRVYLIVSIGRGIPNLEKGVDVRLRDIVVS